MEEMGGIQLKAHKSSVGHKLSSEANRRILAYYDSSAVERLTLGSVFWGLICSKCSQSRVFATIKGLDISADLGG